MPVQVKDVLKMAGLAVDAIPIIRDLVAIGDLSAIGKLIASLHDGLEGKTTPESVANDLEGLRKGLVANDATIASERAEKWNPDV